MTDENQIIRRRLPPELLAEIHKCLPLADAINVLVNVPTRAIYQNNSPRMRRTIQRIKTTINEYIDTMISEEKWEIYQNCLFINNDIEWKPQLDAFLRFGDWMTTYQQLGVGSWSNKIVGVPENFAEELLLNLANSRWTQMMLQFAEMYFEKDTVPIPSFFEQLFYEKQFLQIGDRNLLETMELKADDGRTFRIFDGELHHFTWQNGEEYRLDVILMNKMNWFEIRMTMDASKKFIQQLEYSRWNSNIAKSIQCSCGCCDSLKHGENKLEAKNNVAWTQNLDLFFRRGASLTQFQHFKFEIKVDNVLYDCPMNYIDFLISYITYTKHPEEFIESIDINLQYEYGPSRFINKIRKLCQKEIPKSGKFLNYGDKKLFFISAKIAENNLEFKLANIPTKGAYLFDVEVQFGNGPEEIVGIKIQKMMDEIAESKCNGQIGKGKERKIEKEEDGPTYSGKIMKK